MKSSIWWYRQENYWRMFRRSENAAVFYRQEV